MYIHSIVHVNIRILILFIFDPKMHDSNEIYMFCFSFMCFCVNLDWLDHKTFARNVKSAKNLSKINSHKCDQNTICKKKSHEKIYCNKVHLTSGRGSDESKKFKRQMVLKYSMGLPSGLLHCAKPLTLCYRAGLRKIMVHFI